MLFFLALPKYTTTFMKLSQMIDSSYRFTYRPGGLEAWVDMNYYSIEK